MMNVQEWLESEEKDYGIGLAILGKHCKNRVLLQNMGRKRMAEKLEYEMEKLVESPTSPTSPTPDPSPKERGAKQPLPKKAEQVEQVETSVRKSGNPDILPMVLKAKWHENRNAYKEIRSLHEKLKLMGNATDEDRQHLTERISKMDDTIRANWAEIDAYVPGSEVAPVAAIDHKRMQANRKYISTNLKKLPELTDNVKKAKVLEQLQLRYTEMKTAGENFATETVDELGKVGVEV